MHLPSIKVPLTNLLNSFEERLVIRTLISEKTHLSQFLYSDVFDENDNPTDFLFQNTYSFECLHNLVSQVDSSINVDFIEDVYDIILTLLSRKENLEKFILKKGTLLTTEEWIKEEGKFAEEQLEELKRDLRYEQIEFREVGGNRYVAEYYNGLLIMTDDLYWAKSNVIPIQ